MCKVLDKIEARGGQNEKHNTIIRSYDNGITDLSLIARIAGVAVDFVKMCFQKQEGLVRLFDCKICNNPLPGEGRGGVLHFLRHVIQ